ncbi:uncharacterized protein EDB91DRAFT_1249341 [Suillus paluster]|uniref:uncharacterized protein n=1 Tax=Suillus paluster TaxID=48578 RepID=UPI001B85E687|nr:uncharacterized protein EDB91DRAFT_1249341 [Suillus paluster]KAG1738427.1 hypothetical protein EDB91DRAFT_1249341 [Suillus paluster]
MLAQRMLAGPSASLCSLSPLELLDAPILERVAFYLATGRFIGPPSELIPLLCTSRTINASLRFRSNSHLYSQIFHQKFDCAAVLRRLSWGRTTVECLSEELRKRSTILTRIRHRNVENFTSLQEDLWAVYLMMLENDHKNMAQLCLWAELPMWIANAIEDKCQVPREHPLSWVNDIEGTSLALWLLWMSSNEGSVKNEDPRERNKILHRLEPFLVQGHRFSSAYAPDAFFYLPLCAELEAAIPCTTGLPLPISREVVHYGRKIRLAAPPLVPAALLNYVIRLEVRLDTNPLPSAVAQLPATRVQATTMGLPVPRLTQEDVVDFHFHTRTKFFGDYNGLGSERLDSEWFRIVSCHDPWAVDRPLRGVFYRLGTLTGHRNGRALIPYLQAHMEANMRNRRPSVQGVTWAHERISCVFKEHHCLNPDEPIPAPAEAHGWGEDILNGWLPRRLEIKHGADSLTLDDPDTGRTVRYETYHAERENPYSMPFKKSSEWRGDLPIETVSEDSPHETDDDYEEVCEERSSGVTDIIITGETYEREGPAWGSFSFIGRVRPWDGFVVLLRLPTHVAHSYHGRWIFKGYVHERSLVGRWRETGTAVDQVGYEGGFVLCKVDENSTDVV